WRSRAAGEVVRLSDALLGLEGKAVLITGAARGQGAAEARLFAQYGARVMLADIRDDEGQAVASEIPGAAYVHLDVGDEAAWQQAIAATVSLFGRLDVLINNAGITHYAPIEQMALADFERVLRINLVSVFLGMKSAVPAMKAQGGSIINVSSIAALTGRAGISAYASSKWALRGLSRSAALELSAHKIRVNSIIPGLIETPMSLDAMGADKLKLRGDKLPVGRAGQPADIANLALFLASDASGFCTGGEYLCDGGETAGF
ncbi:MAG TPA: glucose 1-dehydrogenase, partial [Ramlibacter sp.]|nr:glucose 1-dehydrogenase [Ramlibacter sp.]